MGRAAKNTLRLLDYLEANPIIEISKTAEALGLAFNTTSDAIKRLEEAGILVQSAGQQRKKQGVSWLIVLTCDFYHETTIISLIYTPFFYPGL